MAWIVPLVASVASAQSDNAMVDAVIRGAAESQSIARWEAHLDDSRSSRTLRQAFEYGRNREAESAVFNLAQGRDLTVQNEWLRSYLAETGGVNHHLRYLLWLFGTASGQFPGRLEEDVEVEILERAFGEVEREAPTTTALEETLRTPESQRVMGLHNLTTRSTAKIYLLLQSLAGHPRFWDRTFREGDTCEARFGAWTQVWRRGISELARYGMFTELASGHYEHRTYFGLFNLADFATDALLRQRMHMFLDVAFIDIAEFSLYLGTGANHARGGHKSRAKSGGMGSSFEGGLKQLYGEIWMLEPPGMNTWRPPVPAILLRHRHERPVPIYEIANRHPSEYDNRLRSRRYNYAFVTPVYVMGASLFDPNVFNSPRLNRGSFGAWSGVITRDPDGGHRRGVYLDPDYSEGSGYHGSERWYVQDRDVMIAQRWRGGFYQGHSRIDFREGFELVERDGWIFCNNEDEAYIAVRVARGGYDWLTPNQRLEMNDEDSPIIFQTGRAVEYGAFEDFQDEVLAAPIRMDDESLVYTGPNSPTIEFFLSVDPYRMPTIDGEPVQVDRESNYDSPYLQGRAGSCIVTALYGERRWEYDFCETTMREVDPTLVDAGPSFDGGSESDAGLGTDSGAGDHDAGQSDMDTDPDRAAGGGCAAAGGSSHSLALLCVWVLARRRR
ncbi:MAG: hypothetical protein AAGE52_00615 [Myxococcota bacterium]